MLIRSLTLQNFKGIRDQVRIEFKPITLLYGPNSAGKSSIIQSLHYLHDILTRHNLDPDRTRLGAGFIDLGGFHSLVHQHKLTNEIVIGVELDLRETDLSDQLQKNLINVENQIEDDSVFTELDRILSHVESASITLTITWSELRGHPYVKRYTVKLNGQEITHIDASADCRRIEITRLNLRHSLFHQSSEDISEYLLAELLEKAVQPALFQKNGAVMLGVLGQIDALPDVPRPLLLDTIWSEDAAALAKTQLLVLLDMIIMGPLRLLISELDNFRYLGPLRELPSRQFKPIRSPDPSRWSGGLAAWDLLYSCQRNFVETLNDWLSRPEKLNAGYQVKVTRYKHLDLESSLAQLLENKLLQLDLEDMEEIQAALMNLPVQTRVTLQDMSGSEQVEVTPHDMGVGISQMLPVVVMALSHGSGLTAIEQPELHVHPALQVRLGDLFISQAIEKNGVFLLETHSEHIMLRLLRRIRETSEGELDVTAHQLQPSQVQVIYVDHEQGATIITPLRVDETGEFIDRWPKGFFDERAEELF